LARALILLYGRDHVFPEAGWSEMNFIIGHETASPRVFDRFRARIAQALTTANNFSHRLGDNPRSAALLAAAAQAPRAASCHNFVGQGGALSSGKVAPSLLDATDLEIYTAMLSGPENMPVFGDNQLTSEDKRAIINYVQTVKAPDEPACAGIGRTGPHP
jgi:hypothetical protein